VADADPVHVLPASWELTDTLGDVGTVVALSSFTDDTTLHADLVLPVNTELERFNAVEPAASVGVRVLGLAQPVLDPLGEAHHPADVLLAVATALGEPVAGRFPWSSFETLVRTRIEEEQARLPGGADVDPASYYFDALSRGAIFEQGEPEGAPPGPTDPAPPASESRTEGSPDAFPFRLLPYPSLKMAEGRGANRPWLQELPDPMSTVMWNSWAELSPADAERLGIHDGDRLLVESPSGSVEVHVVVDPTVRPGTLGMPLGQGHTEYGRYARGRGVDPLDLVGRLEVDGTRASATASARVRIERLGSGELARFGRSYTERGEGERIPVGWAPQKAAGREVEA
jgi:anaerobic selenocysteine-containing dehydrogenase